MIQFSNRPFEWMKYNSICLFQKSFFCLFSKFVWPLWSYLFECFIFELALTYHIYLYLRVWKMVLKWKKNISTKLGCKYHYINDVFYLYILFSWLDHLLALLYVMDVFRYILVFAFYLYMQTVFSSTLERDQ